MRCKACNTVLEDAEMVRKDPLSEDYADLCNSCYTTSEEALWDVVIDSGESDLLFLT